MIYVKETKLKVKYTFNTQKKCLNIQLSIQNLPFFAINLTITTMRFKNNINIRTNETA